MPTIRETAEKLIREGKSNKEAAELVRKAHDSKTSPACIAWYRGKMDKKATKKAKKLPPATTKRKPKPGTLLQTEKPKGWENCVKLEPQPLKIDGGYSVTKIKTFRGMEGGGYNADLLRDGKKVAFLCDDASGGPLRIEWCDEKAPKVNVLAAPSDPKAEPVTYKGTPEELLLTAFCRALPSYEAHGMTFNMTPDTFVDDLVNMHGCAKKINGPSVLFAMPKKKGYSKLSGVKGMTCEAQRAIIEKKYPTAVFLSDLTLANAVAIMEGSVVL